jgi:hypothetical protein
MKKVTQKEGEQLLKQNPTNDDYGKVALGGLFGYICMSKSVDRLLKNYSNARKSWEAWCFMSGFDNEMRPVNRENNQKINDNLLFFYLRYLAMKDYHIELYKVLKKSKRNNDNIFYLLEKRIKSNSKNKEDVASALNELNGFSTTIQDICDIRDKFYAHLDKDYQDFTSKKSYPVEIQKLLAIIEKAIISLTSLERLNEELGRIDSREDYSLHIES